jgi:hypothetical protein
MDRRPTAVALVVAALAAAARAAGAAELTVTSISPARHGAAARTEPVSVTFDRPVLPASVNASSFRVFGRASGTASGSITFSNGSQTVMLTPTRPFSAGEVVMVNLSHDLVAADTSPLRGAGYAWQFTVATAIATRQFVEIDTMSNRTSGPTRIYGAVATDLDGDGFVDLATVNETSADLRVALNLGNGSGLYDAFLPRHPIGVEASPNEPADFDNDGNVDIVASATSSQSEWIVLGDGDGTFGSTQSVTVGDEPHGVAVLDVDGDGDLDIVNANHASSDLSLLLNDGSGTFGAPTFFDGGVNGEYGLASGDMNNDGIIDLVVAGNQGSEVRTLLGNGNGTFTLAAPQSCGGPPWVVVVGDVNGDGNLDAATANSFAAEGGILLGNGDGTFDPVTTYDSVAHTPSVDLGDLDGDGDLDLVLSSFGAGLWRMFTNDGTGTFTFDQDFTAPSNPSCSVLLDFDNDGDLDMALTDEIADVVVLMENIGPGVVPPACPPSPSGACRAPAVSGKAQLQFAARSPETSQIKWKWLAGAATNKLEFGDPSSSEAYRLCIYDAGALVTSARADAGGLCGSRPCWKETALGWTLKDKEATPDGTQQLNLKSGAVTRASIAFKGKGANLDMPDVGALTGPLDVRLHNSTGAVCWGATYSAPFLSHDATKLKDKAD